MKDTNQHMDSKIRNNLFLGISYVIMICLSYAFSDGFNQAFSFPVKLALALLLITMNYIVLKKSRYKITLFFSLLIIYELLFFGSG